MSKIFHKKPLAIAIGTVIAGSLSATSTANADTNPFGISDLSSGYMQVAQADAKPAEGEKKAEGKCGEGKCGGKMKEQMEKMKEGKCAGAKAADGEKKADGKCGAMMKEKGTKEGKCGGAKGEEAKCGAMMEDKAAEKPAAETPK